MSKASSSLKNGLAPKYAENEEEEERAWGVDDTDENKERGNWSGKLDFFLSCVGYAVGIGNVWRFPYLCFRNGGGAFLIPYLLALVICGIPLFFMETAMGQFASAGAIQIWKIAPIFTGVGYGTVAVTSILCIYYNVIIAWTLYYLASSFATEVPWKGCLNPWNTAACGKRSQLVNSTLDTLQNYTTNITLVKAKTSTEEFWERRVLELSDGITEPNGMRWQLVIALIVAWLLVFACVCKGVKSSGKVVYFTATFPYVILFVLLVRGATLPGAKLGIYFYLKPDWNQLKTFKVWGEACIQIFYSLGPGWGGLITMASYNRFRNNCLRDALLVPIINSGTSIFAGFAVFSVIGFMATEAGVPVKDVVTSGPGLAFVVYPEAISQMPVSPLWAILFFFMLLTLGMDSQFVMLETVVTAIWDELSHVTRKYKNSKLYITAACSIVMFILGLPMMTRGGAYVFILLDWYAAGYSVMVISLCEVIVIGWIFGPFRLLKDIKMMLNFEVPCKWLWWVLWAVFVPAILVFILIITGLYQTNVEYAGYKYPRWSIIVGWMVGMLSIIPIPLYAVYYLLSRPGTFFQRLLRGVRPTEWMPAVEPFRTEYQIMHETTQNGHLVGGVVTSGVKQQSMYDNPVANYTATSLPPMYETNM
ncbi:PREDICTED: sodium- and chloride-dependent glycine transporter 1-like [Priapulus caudatus]|uniref:Transporter n=1 Tax=Priapulus caudatus TaxID=37621 RepID=A0ABM1DWF4_PRICU|nr:PREDICTED: sodium- and chloride-dependent glycine transporter 1-like [Priapulus caudatus]XP_014664276.1 PREDICTED: sodium- and chloride-dependent glycine transporter 1-like [Priapulus caudatus]XP_014664277.1 PREDICTED: sodium- and chloride-dependent glycine transporter 1-like [Priapulus caudatus]XP_014664278.1 PREDICTED: sodium- and chloride-dependent glycine transporter 1-like [Priapulus caudatus]XP_014664279.1 PREDICTED: sodium- and chloride-dependent glycine transporter 1-like [Priapulus 